MNAKRIKSLLREFIPPVLFRMRRRRPATPSVVHAAVETLLEGGPLSGRRLMIDVSMPAFREMRFGAYDGPLWAAFPEAADGLVLDIGAHIGYHTLALAVRYPGSEVISFEPNPANLKRLRANIDLNPDLAARITIMDVAVADAEGSFPFNSSANVDDQTSSGGYLEQVSPPMEAGIYQRAGFQRSWVEVRRLDDLAVQLDWQRVAVIKIDVEGAEHLVLKGAMDLLGRHRPFLCIEVHSVACMLAVDALLLPLGYTVRLLSEDGPGRAHIVAS